MAQNDFFTTAADRALAEQPSFGLPEFAKTERAPSSIPAGGAVPFQDVFNTAAQRYGVPVNVLMALGEQESRFNPTALGVPTKYGRAKGLMQYIDSTAAGMGINPYDPVQSIDAAARQLRDRLAKGYSMQEAVSAHFAGDDRKQWGPKTAAYGQEVLARAEKFLNGGKASVTQPTPGKQQNGVQPFDMSQEQEAYPAAQSAMENMDQNRLRTQALLDEMNKEDPGRYRALTPDELAQLQQQAQSQQNQQPQQKVGNTDPTPLTTPGELPQGNKDGNLLLDSAILLTSGLNTAAKDAKELVSRIPYIGKPIVDAADRFDRWANGKGSEEIFKEWDKNVEASLSPEMVQARKGAWVVEPGDDLGNGKKATSYSFGPAWSDPRAYMSGMLESLPEMAVTMGGAGRLASMSYKAALRAGASREVAAKAAARTATVAGGLLEGGLGGAQSAREVRDDINKMTPDQLKDSDALKAIMAQGKSFEQARSELAENAATRAFVVAGIGTGLFGGMGDRAIAKVVTNRAGGRIRSAITGAIGEGLFEEVPQSVLQQGGQNYALQEADPSIPLTKGVANAAGGGLAIGATMGAGIGAAAPRAGTNEVNPQPEAAPVDTVDPTPTPAEASGPIGRAMQRGAPAAAPVETPTVEQEQAAQPAPVEQPAADAHEFMGPVGAATTVTPKEDPAGAFAGTVERYQDGDAIVRGEDGSVYQFGPGDVIPPDLQQAQTQQQEAQPATETASNEGEKPEVSRVVEEERPATRTLDQMEETELRERLKYLARQAKQTGWDNRLMAERRKVEAAIDAKTSQRETTGSESAAANGLTAEENRRLKQILNNDARTQAEKDEATRLIEKSNASIRDEVPSQPSSQEDVSAEGLTLVHGSGNGNLTLDDIQIIRANGQKQGKKGRVYGGFYGTSEKDSAQAEGYAGMMEGTPTVYDVKIKPGTKIFQKEGDITRLSENTINDLVSKGYGVVVGTDPRGRTEYAVIDKNAIQQLSKRGAATTENSADSKVKWFGTAEKAQAYIEKKGLGDTHEVRPAGRSRFEVQPKADTAAGAPAAAATTKELTGAGPRYNRARKLVGEIGSAVSPSGDVGTSVKAGRKYRISRIEKNGIVHLVDQENADTARISVAEIEAARSRNVAWNKVAETQRQKEDAARARYGLEPQEFIDRNLGEMVQTAQDETERALAMAKDVQDGLDGLIDDVRKDANAIDGEVVARSVAETAPKQPEQQRGEWQSFPEDSGTLSVPRSEMPQIKAEHRGAMVNFLEARGVTHWEGQVPADTLKPTQAEFSPERVAKAAERTEGDRSILVSNDGYVLDGHHQWLAARDKGENVKAIILDAPMRDLLPLAHEFPSSMVDTASAPETAKTEPKPAESATNQPETASEQTKTAENAPKTEYGATNKLVSQDRAAELRKRLKAKFSQLNSGLDPEILAIGTELAVFHLEAGVRKFADFARTMASDLDVPLNRLRPYLRSWYNGGRDMMEDSGISIDGMDSPETVRAELAKLNTEEQPQPVSQPAGSLDDMVAQFDREVTTDEPKRLDQPGQGPLEGIPADPVQRAESQEPAGERAARRSGTDAPGNERAGSPGIQQPRSLGDDAREVSVPAGRGEPAAAGQRNEPGSETDAGRNGDRERAVRRERSRPVAGTVAEDRPVGAFTINADEIGKGGDKTKYRNNVAAIRLLKELETANRPATREEQAILSKYVGWGGLPQAFERTDGSANKGWEKEVADLKALMTPEEYRAAQSSTKNAHYTSPEIVSGMWDAMRRLGFTGGRVIEPSVGVGNFFGLMPADVRAASALHGVELDHITSGIATQLYPEAKIARMGYQDYVIPDGYFDIAIGNPPFGADKLYDGRRKDLSGFNIHNYFFARSIDALRPGGVLGMVVTNRMLDSASDKARQYIADRADFLGAIRLPNNAFAKNAGTEVTTDIIFLRRRAEGEAPAGAQWMNTVDYTDKEGRTVPLNEYFAANPDMMLGDFGAYGSMYREGEPALVAREGQNTAAELAKAIARLPENIITRVESVKPETRATVAAENARVGSMFLDGDQVMIRRDDVMGESQGEAVSFPNEKARQRVTGMIGLRDHLADLRKLQLDPRADETRIEAARGRLNQVYDAFVKEFGPVNLDANKRLFRDDPTWPQISALEEGFDKGISAAVAKKTGEEARAPSASKAAIFSKRTQSPYSPPTSASTAKDALVTALAERGHVDMAMMSELYGKSEDEIARELGDLIFSDPNKGWVTRDEYLSGNVKAKLAQARERAQTDPAYARNVEALEAVQPKDIEAVDISVKPGASWLPADTMAAFANHIAETTDAKAFYNPVTAKWSFPGLNASAAAAARFGTGRMDVKSIIEAAAAQKSLQVYDNHQDGSRTLNETETQLANDKANAVREEFGRWIWSEDARRQTLARLYNDQFNTDVPRVYDGSHLTFPGKISDDIIRLRPHQGNAVWRIVQGGSTLTDHVVGAGKTFTLIAAAMELRRMGLARKPVFAVPNHLVGQWAADFVKLYPGANVLAATKKDFEKENRKRLFARIATGDWDAVIVAHSSFGKVQVDPQAEAEFIQEQIADLEASIEAIREAEGRSSRNVKDAAKRRDALQEKLKALLDTENKDDSLYWNELGIDALFVDEAHEFKNLAYSTSMRNVAGLGDTKGSQKAMDMFMKVRQVLKATGGRNVVFATGTPISNTMAEMYTMQRYLDYDTLQAQGLSHFDAWARMFGEVVTDWELSPSGKYKMNSRFAKFVNMPELMQRYTSFADVINRDDINRQLAAQGKKLPVPKVAGGKPTNVVVQRSQDQADYIGEPVKDAEGNDTDQYPRGTLVWRSENLPKRPEKGADNMLKIMSDARKAALDMRLIDPRYPDHPHSKVNEAADRIKGHYDKWHDDRGTQLVFIDLSTPKNAKAGEAARLRDLAERADNGDEDAIAALDKISPDELLALESDFSVYDDLKQKLIARGIPEAEVAFIHDAKTELQKEELFGKVRTGRIRVLLGSTAKMGAGMNVQDRLVALHHLDAPWRPSDLEQREGRIIRQGNRLYESDPEGFEVSIERYATKQTLDSRMWQTIEGKANFIEQVRKGNTGVREIEDVGGEAANAAEMKAASSGNPLILEEMTLRQRIRRLENERTGHDREQFRIRDSIQYQQKRAVYAERELADLRQDVKRAQPAEFAMTIGNETFDKRKDAGEAILAAAANMEKNGIAEQDIGSYGDFTLHLYRLSAEQYEITVQGAGAYTAKFGLGADPVGTAMRVTNAVKDLGGAIEKMEQARDQAQATVPKLQEQLADWPKDAELNEARTRHSEVLEQLKPKKKESAPSVANPETPAQTSQQDNLQSWSRISSGQRQASQKNLAEMRRMRAQAAPADQFAELVRRIEFQNQRETSNPQRVLASLRAAELSGQYDAKGMQLAQWLIRQYPNVARSLNIELKQGGDDLPAGNYNVPTRLISLYSNYTNERGQNVAGTDAVTATHEIMHHLERMLPRDVQEAIAERWFDAMKARLAEYKSTGQTRRGDLLADLVAGMYGDQAGLERARQAMMSGELPASDYQFASPSEYWAENGARIIAERKAEAELRAGRNWVDKAVDVMRSIIEKIRNLVGRRSDTRTTLDDALDSVLAGDGRFVEDATILNRVGDDLYGLSDAFTGDNMPQMRSGLDPDPNPPSTTDNDGMIKRWWDTTKNWTSDKLTQSMPKLLATVPMRPLVRELGRNLAGAADYMRLKQSMDAMRSEWHAKTDKVAQRWLKYRVANKAENAELMDLMHEATRVQVDPSEKFAPLMTDRERDALRTAPINSSQYETLVKKAAQDKKRREAHRSLQERWNKLSPEAREIYIEVRDTYKAMADAYEGILLKNMEKAINVRIKKAEREHRADMEEIADLGLTGQEKQDAIDKANGRLRAAKTKISWNRKARITQLRQQFEMERLAGPYFPLARFGNFFVTVRNKQEGFVESFSRFEDVTAQRKFANMMRQNPNYEVEVGALDDSASVRKAVDPNFVADVEDILADLPNADKVKDEVWQRYLETLPDLSVRKNRIHRKGRAGFDADALRAFGNQMFHGSHQLARLAHSFDMEEAIDQAREEARHTNDPVRDTLVVNEIAKRHEFVMNPTGGSIAQAITSAAFIYHLSVSPAAAMVNMSQTVIIGVPILAAYNGGARGFTRASNQLMKALRDFTVGRGYAERSKYLTADEKQAMEQGYNTGVIDRTQSHDLAGVGETGVEYSPKRAKAMAAISWAFHHTERLNREVTYLAAYRMARAKGESHAQAINTAGDLTWKTHFDYQNTSRPRVMHSDTAKALLVFRNYNVNMLWRLFRDTHQALNGESKEIRREAFTQLAGITGMMMANAGIKGTWLFGIAMVLAGMFLDDGDDPEVELKKAMVKSIGPMMAGIALDGIPGYITGTSLSERIGMPDLWFRSPDRQLEGQDEYNYWQTQALGAAPGIIQNAMRGFQMMQQDQTYRGIETLAPKVIKDLMRAYRYQTEGVTTLKGDKLLDEVTPWETFVQALGFTPAALAERYDINNANMNKQKFILGERKKLLDRYARADKAGDEKALERIEGDMDKFSAKYPEQEITEKAIRNSLRSRERNRENNDGGMLYNNRLRDRILEEQSPTVYR